MAETQKSAQDKAPPGGPERANIVGLLKQGQTALAAEALRNFTPEERKAVVIEGLRGLLRENFKETAINTAIAFGIGEKEFPIEATA
jgi:hypothetical protein